MQLGFQCDTGSPYILIQCEQHVHVIKFFLQTGITQKYFRSWPIYYYTPRPLFSRPFLQSYSLSFLSPHTHRSASCPTLRNQCPIQIIKGQKTQAQSCTLSVTLLSCVETTELSYLMAGFWREDYIMAKNYNVPVETDAYITKEHMSQTWWQLTDVGCHRIIPLFCSKHKFLEFVVVANYCKPCRRIGITAISHFASSWTQY